MVNRSGVQSGKFFRRKLLSLTSEEEIQEYLNELAFARHALREDVVSMQWHMRGGLGYNEAWNLCWDQRLDIKKFVTERVSVVKETGLPLL